MSEHKKRVAVVGANGIADQQFLVALAGHPWFEVVMVAASERSAGKTYGEAAGSGRRQCRLDGVRIGDADLGR